MYVAGIRKRVLNSRQYKANKKYYCPECERTSINRLKFSSHLKFHMDEIAYKCGECELGFSTQKTYDGHVYDFHAIRDRACKWCSLSIRGNSTVYLRHNSKCKRKNSVVHKLIFLF